MIEFHLLKPYIVGPAMILAMGAGVFAAILPSGGEGPSVGGKEQPPAEAVAKLEAMPRHPAAVTINEPVAVRRGAERTFAAQGDGESVVAFYSGQLHAQGWRAEAPMTVEYSDAHLDGTVAKMHKQTFLTNDARVTVTAVESEKDPKQKDTKEKDAKQKDPKQGNVRLSLVVEPF
jgi:hypothetical protein